MTAPVNHALTGLRECLIDFGIIQITMIPVCIHIGSVAQQIPALNCVIAKAPSERPSAR